MRSYLSATFYIVRLGCNSQDIAFIKDYHYTLYKYKRFGCTRAIVRVLYSVD